MYGMPSLNIQALFFPFPNVLALFPVFSLISEKKSIILPEIFGGYKVDPYNTLLLFISVLVCVYIIKNI